MAATTTTLLPTGSWKAWTFLIAVGICAGMVPWVLQQRLVLGGWALVGIMGLSVLGNAGLMRQEQGWEAIREAWTPRWRAVEAGLAWGLVGLGCFAWLLHGMPDLRPIQASAAMLPLQMTGTALAVAGIAALSLAPFIHGVLWQKLGDQGLGLAPWQVVMVTTLVFLGAYAPLHWERTTTTLLNLVLTGLFSGVARARSGSFQAAAWVQGLMYAGVMWLS